MDVFLLSVRAALFIIFAVSATGKFLDLKGSEKAFRDFGVPREMAAPFAVMLPALELILSFSFLYISTSWYGSAAAVALLMVFIAAMAWQLSKGNAPDCHCFGQLYSEPIGKGSLIRNLLIAILPLILLLTGRGRQGPPIGSSPELIAQATVLALLAAAMIVTVLYLRRSFKQDAELKKRLEVVEILESGGTFSDHSSLTDPADSLPIGAQFPDLKLPDTSNRITTFDHLMGDVRPKLFIFVGPKCDPCKAMIPTFLEWKREFADSIRFVFVSSGTAEENIERFGEELSSGMLLQKKKEFASKVFAPWTPSAILVTSDGTVASHVAAGDGAIMDLVDKIRSGDAADPAFYHLNPIRPGRIRIGQTVPEFRLKDLDGKEIGSDQLSGRRTLAVFLSTTCTHCAKVVEQIRKWEKEESNGTGIVVFSEGDPSVHREMGLDSPVLIEDGYATATKLGMLGVPSGLLIDENGIIISETAVGSAAIWSLLGIYDQ